MDIKNFFKDIHPDLLNCVSAFRECGFSSSVMMKYWHELDFQNLEVEVPEGHHRLILYLCTVERFIW